MKILWIDNDTKWRAKTTEIVRKDSVRVDFLSESILALSISDIAKFIYDNHSIADLVIINLNLIVKGYIQSESVGIKLLKYIRLYNLRQHCIIYSFLNKEQLIFLDPQNLIVFSGGVSFIRLPFDFSTLLFEDVINRTSPEDLSAYFKAEMELPNDRHFFANWFGVLQLWNIQRAVEKMAGNTTISYIEKSFTSSIREMNSYQGLLARYIKKIHVPDIERHIKELNQKKLERFAHEERERSKIQQEIKVLADQDIECDIQIQILKETQLEVRNGLLIKLLSKIRNYPTIIQRKIDMILDRKETIKNQIINDCDYLELIKLIENEKSKVYELQRKINRKISSMVKTLEEKNNFSTDDFSLEYIRKRLATEKPQIVFVDDQANDGWTSIFQRMIYGRDCNSFHTIQPSFSETIDEISKRTVEEIINTNAQLLILDLRLAGEKGNISHVKEISGVQVLKKLKEAHITCPVLITTASNKVWSYKETISSGAAAFWIKEGLDEKVEIKSSTDNYLRFLDLVYILCFGEEFNFLYKDFQFNIRKIINQDSLFWWETAFWGDRNLLYPKSGEVNKEEVIDCLNQAFQLFEDYLKLRIQSFDNVSLNENIASLIVVQFARILEIIHSVDNQKSGVTLSDKMKDQLSERFYKKWTVLLKLRNGIAHSFTADFSRLKDFILHIFNYLNDNKDFSYNVENEHHELIDPVDGDIYESIILSKHPSYESYYLENPGLSLLDKRDKIILDKRYNTHLESQILKEGMKIRFELKVKIWGSISNFYANKCEIIH